MSVSEFRYAVYSGSVWNEWFELDDDSFLFDEGERLCLSILKYFFCTLNFKFCFIYNFFYYLFFLFLFSDNYLLLLFRLVSVTIYSQTFFHQDFEKMKVYPFHRDRVHSLFVVVGGNCICHSCVFGD